MFDSQAVNPANIVRVDIEDNAALYAAYMPFVSNGGIFVHLDQLPNQAFTLGTDVYLMLQLKHENESLSVHGKAVWVTGRNNARRAGGIGVQFQDKGETKHQLETLLTGQLDSETPTFTL